MRGVIRGSAMAVFPISTRGWLTSAAIAFCALLPFAGRAGPLAAQTTTPISVTLSFVNQFGGPGAPPPGTAEFIFTPVPTSTGFGATPVTLNTTSAAQSSSQTFSGSLIAGATYTFQEILPAGTTFLSATAIPSSGAGQQGLSNGGSFFVNPGISYSLNIVNQIGSPTAPGSAPLTVTVNFVNASGQPTTPASGTAGGVTFTVTPAPGTTSGTVFPQTFTTTAATGSSSGIATGTLQSGTYTFQEALPIGTCFVSGSVGQTGFGVGQQTLTNGGTFSVTSATSYSVNVVDQINGSLCGQSSAGMASLTVFLTLTTPTGQAATSNLGGYGFTLTMDNGTSQVQTTNDLGQATFVNLLPGVYTLNETSTGGATFSSMTINGVSAQQGQQFQVQTAGTYDVNVTNLMNGSGNVTIQVQAVDQNGSPISAASLIGYGFTISPQTGGTTIPVTVTTSSAGQATANLPPGSYTISEIPPTGSSLLTYSFNGVSTPSGSFTVGVGQSTTIVATNRATGAIAGTTIGVGGARTISLISGCNNVVNTFSDGTPGQTVAAGVAPNASLLAIWRYDNSAQVFRAAYFSTPPGGSPPPVDISSLNRLDPIFICVNGAATFSEPGA